MIAPTLCLLTPNMWGKKEGDQVDHHYITYIQVFVLMCGEKNHLELILFLFPLSPVFRHYIATAAITHRYKCHSLSLLSKFINIFSTNSFFKHNIM